jgi:osmotically-inducible protein OsmY
MRFFALSAAVAGAAALAFFLDPRNGRRRRKLAVDRTAGLFRRTRRRAARGPDDVTLARKVETEIFRGAAVPKGEINVNAEEGVVYLRGEVERPELIDDLEQAARKVQGVRDVANFVHVAGTAPRMKA